MQSFELNLLIQQFENICNTNSETIVCEMTACFTTFLGQLIFEIHHVINVAQGERWYDQEELLQMRVGLIAKLRGKHVHQHAEILSTFCKVLGHVFDAVIEVLGRSDRLSRETFFLTELTELHDITEVGYEFDRIASERETTATNHTDVTHGISNFRYQLSELIQIGLSLSCGSQPPNILHQAIGSFVGILIVVFLAIGLPVASLFVEFSLDVFIIEELREDDKLASQKLIGEIHRSIHDTRTMSTNTVGNVLDVDRLQELAFSLLLHKDLIVQVVRVSVYEHVDVAHDHKNIQTLFQGLTRQMRLDQIQTVFLFGQVTHLFIGLPIVLSDRSQIIEGGVQMMRDMHSDVDVVIH
mmetsp:Transcript_32874/g.82568  ORF Transcript_32874/g.82568 Transcript_32874/m.82568 type:complete len:355 (+) Transcript_32874:400-1464(+)